MVDATHISFAADDRSYFSLIKKEIRQAALNAQIAASRVNELDLIVAEMTSNIFKYSEGGEILMGVFSNGGSPFIELISIDSGPGMLNPARMIQDGVSTTNTMGHGLGSIKRLSDTFDLYSMVGWGTIVLSRVYSTPPTAAEKDKVSIHPIIVSKPGETCSGDGFVHKKTDKYMKFMLADGLGHGIEANKAVNEAAIAFKVFPDFSPTETLRFIHSSIKKTRGAVINVVGYDYESKTWTSTGVGNIAARLFSPTITKNQMSYNGIVGHNIPGSLNDQHHSAKEYNHVMLCSDGIHTRIDTSKYPQIYKYDPSILSAAIYKDHARRTDDMSVVILKAR